MGLLFRRRRQHQNGNHHRYPTRSRRSRRNLLRGPIQRFLPAARVQRCFLHDSVCLSPHRHFISRKVRARVYNRKSDVYGIVCFFKRPNGVHQRNVFQGSVAVCGFVRRFSDDDDLFVHCGKKLHFGVGFCHFSNCGVDVVRQFFLARRYVRDENIHCNVLSNGKGHGWALFPRVQRGVFLLLSSRWFVVAAVGVHFDRTVLLCWKRKEEGRIWSCFEWVETCIDLYRSV